MQKSRHKKGSKMRCLPGDVWKGVKIAMLEGKWDRWFPEETNRAKSYRKLQHKKANRRFRRSAQNEMREMREGSDV